MLEILNAAGLSIDAIRTRQPMETGVASSVKAILEDVRQNGDEALYRLTEKFDGVRPETLEVCGSDLEFPVDDEFLEILRQAADNIRDFHRRQCRTGYLVNERPGVVMGQKVLPLERVGLYVPGGTASYPSTVLMNCIPAKLAGVREIVMVTPPGRDGKIAPAILAAAKVAGVDRIFRIGGAQAVAALAYGTGSVPKVDKITGPGNVFVAEAKRQVYGLVDIDMIAGPSEILIVADGTADARFIAADLLSQAEHDKNAAAILLTDSSALAEAVRMELERQLALLERAEIARASIEKNGRIVLTESLEQAFALSNAVAPEHLEICTASPFDWLDRVQNAGSVFLGSYAPEPLGDYFSGTNHTLPTGGTARFASPLGVDDFVKKTCFTYYTRDAFGAVAEKVARFADREGLTAHARSARIRNER